MKISTLVRAVPALLATALVTGCAVIADTPSREAAIVRSRPAPLPDRAEASRRPPDARDDLASWYGSWHHGRLTASGEPFDMDDLTAAHPSLPLGACVEVTHLANGRRVFVRVNDRGPYVPGRSIDLSYRAAQTLSMVDDGVARVRIRRAGAGYCAAGGEVTTH